MIVELKSLLPLIYGENLEQSTELSAAPPVESLQTVLPALAGESSYSLMQGISAAGGEQNGGAELQEQSRVTDLLEQLIAVSEKNAESSERIADLLEQQNSPSALLYD